jgi:hypothetical protein
LLQLFCLLPMNRDFMYS